MTYSRTFFAAFTFIGFVLSWNGSASAANYQIYKDAVCTPNTQCGIDFANVPAGKVVTITNFSCYLRVAIGSSPSSMQLVVVNNSNGSRAFAVTASFRLVSQVNVGSGGYEELYTSNDIIRAVGRPGQHFKTYAQVQKNSDGTVGTVTQLSCGISGSIN